MKWRESLKMQAIFLHSMLEELEHQTGAAGSQDVANRTMFVSGKRWVRANSPLVRQVHPDVNALGEVLTIALKSMNIRSRVQVTDTSVTVLNMACPLLEWAKEHQIEPNRICQAVCGEHASFFKGVSYSYPVYVSYRASHMMGRGHPMCKKVFSTR
jgi:predicted ArsR family transcriptional regulator